MKTYEKGRFVEIDNEKLISEIFRRKALWNTSNIDYSKRHITKGLWNDVANALDCNLDSVKKRWKSLKDNYRAELKKIRQHEKTNTKWGLFEKLSFLQDVIGEATTLPTDSNAMPRPIVCNEAATNSVFELIEFPKFDDNSSCYDRQSSPIESSNSRKRAVSPQEDILQPEENEQSKVVKTDQSSRNDADYHFLMSFLPHMRSMSEMGNLNFRLEMSKLLIAVKKQDQQTMQQ